MQIGPNRRGARVEKRRGLFKVWWLLGGLAVSVCAWLATGWYLADRFLHLGETSFSAAQESVVLGEIGLADLPREALTLSGAGADLAGTWFEHPQPKDCAVILLPGIGGNRIQVLPALPLFRDLGCHVLAYDPRGTGGSSAVHRGFGYHEKWDNANVVGWVAQRSGLPATRIGIWGPSFGAAVGLLTLEVRDDLGFVIADSTFSAFRKVTYETLALLAGAYFAEAFSSLVLFWLEQRTGIVVDDIDVARAARDRRTPVLLIHATADPAMDIAHSRAVYAERGHTPMTLQPTDWGAGHADSALVDPVAYRTLVWDFLAAQGFTTEGMHPANASAARGH